MRSDKKRLFPLENQEKKVQRCALHAPHYDCHFFLLRAHLFVLAPLSERLGGWAQFDRRAHVAGDLGAIPAVCRAWQAFKTFLALGMDKANPRVSAISSIVSAYKGYPFFYGFKPFAHVPDPEVTLTFGLFSPSHEHTAMSTANTQRAQQR